MFVVVYSESNIELASVGASVSTLLNDAILEMMTIKKNRQTSVLLGEPLEKSRPSEKDASPSPATPEQSVKPLVSLTRE